MNNVATALAQGMSLEVPVVLGPRPARSVMLLIVPVLFVMVLSQSSRFVLTPMKSK